MHVTGQPIPTLTLPLVDCRHCGADLSDRVSSVAYCPHCGWSVTPLDQTVWPQLRRLADGLFSRLGVHCFQLRGTPVTVLRPGQSHSPMVLGYSSALFNLGKRYERRNGRGIAEAIRCYRKSARLGNADAIARLAAGRRSPTSVRVIDPESSLRS